MRLTSRTQESPAVCMASLRKDSPTKQAKVSADNVGGQGVKLLSSSVLNARKKT